MAKYYVVHPTVHHQGRLLAVSDTSSFGKKGDNEFRFSIAAQDIADSEFSLSESDVTVSGDNAVPVLGAIIQFRPSDFVTKELKNN